MAKFDFIHSFSFSQPIEPIFKSSELTTTTIKMLLRPCGFVFFVFVDVSWYEFRILMSSSNNTTGIFDEKRHLKYCTFRNFQNWLSLFRIIWCQVFPVCTYSSLLFTCFVYLVSSFDRKRISMNTSLSSNLCSLPKLNIKPLCGL